MEVVHVVEELAGVDGGFYARVVVALEFCYPAIGDVLRAIAVADVVVDIFTDIDDRVWAHLVIIRLAYGERSVVARREWVSHNWT